ncbi:MAG: SLATT domain-containing protein [Kiritimatiellae bacterium]|nr:SLATT domain-containing protein [Kiritimatiellia bacterium]
MSDSYNILEDAVRDIFVRTVWSHKIQEKQADIYQKQYKCMETINILCASLASIGILSSIRHGELWIKIISAVLSFATVFIGTYFKSFSPNKLARVHKETANKLLIVRNEFTCLLTSIKLKNKSVEELEDRYRALMEKANEVYKDASTTTDKAVDLAKKGLQVKGDNTFSEEEIDSYLPAALQKGNRK